MGVGRGKLLQYSFLPPASGFQLNICFDSVRRALEVQFLIRFMQKEIKNESFT